MSSASFKACHPITEIRASDHQGNLLLLGSERAELEKARAEKAEREREEEALAREQAESALAEVQQSQKEAISRLLKLGLTIEQVAEAFSLSVEEVKQF